MVWFSAEFLGSGAGVLASVGAAMAGLVRFQAWWTDRVRQRRIESAVYFKEKGSAEWQKDFGDQQLVRANFAELTGIDRTTGHEAMVRFHSRLGGTDADWKTLHDVGPFLVATGKVARVRKLGRRDCRRLLIIGATALVLFLGGASLVAWAINTVARTDWTAPPLTTILSLIVAIVYAGIFFLFALVCARHCSHYFNARSLYRKTVMASRARREERVHPRSLRSDDLSLVDVSRHS